MIENKKRIEKWDDRKIFSFLSFVFSWDGGKVEG